MSPDCGPVLVFVEEIGEKYLKCFIVLKIFRFTVCNCDLENYFKFLCVRLTVQYENLEPLPRTSLKPEWTFSHKHQIINKFRELGMTSNDDSGKNKTRNISCIIKKNCVACARSDFSFFHSFPTRKSIVITLKTEVKTFVKSKQNTK